MSHIRKLLLHNCRRILNYLSSKCFNSYDVFGT
nr:MAG TPA: hypothetical protein [Caudoviricetes sp.]